MKCVRLVTTVNGIAHEVIFDKLSQNLMRLYSVIILNKCPLECFITHYYVLF
jgi:hypothetical protein